MSTHNNKKFIPISKKYECVHILLERESIVKYDSFKYLLQEITLIQKREY